MPPGPAPTTQRGGHWQSLLWISILAPGERTLGGKRFEKFDGHRRIDAPPHAHELAGPGADETANPWERIVAADHLDGLGIFAEAN
jgi:hypothetical protein